ncbi:MAG: recombinase family protein [Nitrospinae bacterium]|nr:recombinase family protein [Nitrospinota bacterium]
MDSEKSAVTLTPTGSGANRNRPKICQEKLADLDALAQAEFERILITSPDRLARKYVHQVLLIEELERYGCQVDFLDRPMSQDSHDQLLLQIRGAVAEYERSLIAERMRRGRQTKFRAGLLLPWVRVPYGYRVNPDRPRDPKELRLEQAETALVAEMFTYYLEAGHAYYTCRIHLPEQVELHPGLP